MKCTLKAALILGSVIGFASSAAVAEDRRPGDGDGLRFSMSMNFGSPVHQANGLGLNLRYGPSQLEPGRWKSPALFDARHSAGQWQSLKLSGVDVLNLKTRMQADGEDTNYAGWIIGGLVGIGVVAIIARELANDDQESFDINGRNGDNR